MRRAFALRELRPDLLRHVWQHRMEKHEEAFQGRERRRRRIRVVLVQPRLDRLRVPVAEVVEGEVVERVGRRGELEPRPRHPRPRRAWHRCARGSTAPRGRAGAPRALVPSAFCRISRDDVPELVGELAALLDRAGREAHVLRRGVLEQAVAGCVGAVLLDRLERIEPGSEALRHPPPVGRVDRRVDVDACGTGSRPSSSSPAMIIRASQRKMIPRSVELTSFGYQRAELGRVLGPAECRERPQLRRRTTCRGRPRPARRSRDPHSAHASGSDSTTVMCPSGQYQTGIRWPHQSWRDTHQGRIESIQRRYTSVYRSGRKRTRPSRTASIAGAASSVHVAPPLQRDQRLDPGAAAIAVADRVPVGLRGHEQIRALAGSRRSAGWLLPASALRSRPHPRSCSRRGRSR